MEITIEKKFEKQESHDEKYTVNDLVNSLIATSYVNPTERSQLEFISKSPNAIYLLDQMASDSLDQNPLLSYGIHSELKNHIEVWDKDHTCGEINSGCIDMITEGYEIGRVKARNKILGNNHISREDRRADLTTLYCALTKANDFEGMIMLRAVAQSEEYLDLVRVVNKKIQEIDLN